MKLTATLAAIALTTSTAFAENYPTQLGEPVTKTCCNIPAPEQETSSAEVPWAAIAVIAGIVLYAHSQKQSDPDAPRPDVEAEMCMEKVGGVDVLVACDD